MKKVPTTERINAMTLGFKNLTLSAHDLRWQCLGEGDDATLETLEYLCDNLESCVRKITILKNELEAKQGTKKKTLMKYITG